MGTSVISQNRNVWERKAAILPGAPFSNFWKSPWPAAGVALIIRFAYLFHYSSHYSRQALGIVPFLFESGNIAYSVATGQGFASPFHIATGPTAWMTPVYPLLLAGIFRLFGVYSFESFVVAVALNIVFIVLTCIPLFYATKYVGGPSAAIGATWLWAVFPNAILIPVQSLWEASLSALLLATILWASFSLCRLSSLRAYCMYGLLWGFSLMTNPASGAILPILFGWIAWRIHTQHRCLLKLTAAGIVTILCCIPWTMRNYEAFHAMVPLRSVGGLALWLGNSEYAQPRWHGQGHPIDDSQERARYISLGEAAYMHEKLQLAITYMKDHPAREMRLIGRRFLALWCGGTAYPIADFLSIHSLQFRLILLFNVAVALGTLAGLIILFREKDPYLVPLASFPLLFPITYYLTMIVPRYRLPIDPILTGLSAVACSRLLRHNKKMTIRPRSCS
jgi:hypothetical protein